MKSIHEIKSISNKIINQDYISKFENKNLGVSGIIVADGLGSHYLAEKGSEICVQELKILLESLDVFQPNFEELFKTVLYNLKDKAELIAEIQKLESKQNVLGTTLICIIEYEDKFVIAYIGNGSIWHIRGNYTHFPPQRYLPWSSINLLNPHTNDEDGKEALYRLFSLESNEENVYPTIIEVSKDNKLYGDIFIVSSDGLFSNDKAPIAKDREGGIWISGETKMEILYSKIKSFLFNQSSNTLEKEIEAFYSEIKEKKLLDDCTSIGIIVTEQALIYNQNINENNKSI